MNIFSKLLGRKDTAAKETGNREIEELITRVKALPDEHLEQFLKGLGVYDEEGKEAELKEVADAGTGDKENLEKETNEEKEIAKVEEENPTESKAEAHEQVEGAEAVIEQQTGNPPDSEPPAEEREANDLSALSPEQASEPVNKEPAETEGETVDAGDTAESEDTIKALLARVEALESELNSIREVKTEDSEEDEQGYGGVSSKHVLNNATKPAGTDKARSKEEWREKFING